MKLLGVLGVVAMLGCNSQEDTVSDARGPAQLDGGARDGGLSDLGVGEVADAARSDAGTVSGRDAGEGDATLRDAAAEDAAGRDADSVEDAASNITDAGSASRAYFPPGAWMYQDVSAASLSADSRTVTQWLADNGGFGLGHIQIDFSIEVLEATGVAPRAFQPSEDFYEPDCDRVRMPLPAGGNLEGETGYECQSDGDCHLIVVDRAANRLYEMWRANVLGGTFFGGCAALWDMTQVYSAEGRGEQCTSADAAGFPIAPLLFSADEIAAGQIDHAIRFILPNARMRRGFYVHPATHAGGPSGPSSAPVYGTRWRLRSDYPVASLPNEAARIVARALQRYGMALADGGNVALTAQSDRHTTAKWDQIGLGPRDLAAIQPTDFEVVDTGPAIALTFDCTRTPINEF